MRTTCRHWPRTASRPAGSPELLVVYFNGREASVPNSGGGNSQIFAVPSALPLTNLRPSSLKTRGRLESRLSPWENGYVESFNGKFRNELLNGELFLGLADARWVIDRWRLDYNHRRRHSALGYQTPAAFAANCVLEDSATLHPPGRRTTTDPKLSHSEWYKIWG